jgi:hypothetical protein
MRLRPKNFGSYDSRFIELALGLSIALVIDLYPTIHIISETREMMRNRTALHVAFLLAALHVALPVEAK